MGGGEGRLCVEVLGPLRVSDGAGRDVTPDGSLQRRLLALLVLHRGRVLSADLAIEALWPGRPPGDPAAALQTHVSRLRRGLPAGVIESAAAGYRIAAARLDVDADRLADAVHRAADHEDGEALATIDAILERWHGPAYPELADVDSGRVEAMGLAEVRVRAAEARAERRLAAGATDGLIAELAAMADDDPLRERPRELLMSALVATGRHAEALRVYDDFRRLLAEELGIAPSPALSAKQADVLRGTDTEPWKPTRRLPLAVTSLEGRMETLHQIITLAEARRLLTLIGPWRSRQDPAPHRDRSPPAGVAARPPRRDVRVGGRQRGVRRRRRRRRADDRPPRRGRAGGTLGGGARGDSDGLADRQLRARPRPDRRSGRSSPGRLPERVGHRHEPRAVARGWRAAVRGTATPDERRRGAGGPPVRRAGARGDAAVRSRCCRAGEHRRSRPASRRAAAGDRVGGGALAHARCG